jgi:hypothetical protein
VSAVQQPQAPPIDWRLEDEAQAPFRCEVVPERDAVRVRPIEAWNWRPCRCSGNSWTSYVKLDSGG